MIVATSSIELVFQAHRLLYHSNLGLRVIKKKKFNRVIPPAAGKGDVDISGNEAQGPSRTCNESKEEEEEMTTTRWDDVFPS